MVLEPICCPDCDRSDVVKHGRSAAGKQRYCCRNCACSRRSFILNFSYRVRLGRVCELSLSGKKELGVASQ